MREAWLKICCLAVLCLALIGGARAGFAPVNATYEMVENNFQGVQLTYALLDLEFDEPVFYSDNAACGCIDGRSPVCSGKIPSPIVDPAPSQGVLVANDTWYDVVYELSTDSKHFKFFVDPANYPGTCPIILIEYQSNYGENPFIIGQNRVPDSVNYDFIHNPWTRDTLWICPQHRFYGFGWYHIKTIVTSPQVPYTSYRWRWRTLAPDPCTATPANITTPGPTDNWVLLQDNIANIRNVTELLSHYRFYTSASCTDLALSARSIASSQFGAPGFGDPNMMVSWTEPNLDLQMASRIDFHAPTEWDDWLTFRNLCSPNGSPFLLYIVIDNWQAAPWYELMMVATTKGNTFLVRPIGDLGPNSFTTALANDFGRLECGGVRGQEREHLRSVYPAYLGGCDQQDLWGCQMYFVPVNTNEDPTVRASHFFPDSKSNPHTLFIRDLEWGSFANYTSNNPNKMKFAVWVSTRDGDTYKQHIHNPIDSCEIRWNNNIVNAAGVPITGYTTFSPRKFACDPAAFSTLKDSLDTIVKSMQTETSDEELLKLHVETQFVISSRDWRSCRAELASYVASKNDSLVFPNQQACNAILDSDAFRADPCCMWRKTVNDCCEGQDVPMPLALPSDLQSDTIQSQCIVSECTTVPLQRFIQTQDAIHGKDNICTKNWAERSSAAALHTRTTFVQQCRLNTYGADNLGRPCVTDADCLTTCNQSRKMCNDGDNEVINCWAQNIDPVLARYLFDYWNIPDDYTPARFVSEVNTRHMIDTCVGPTALHHRDHWQYASIYSGCTDACLDPANGIDQEPYCYEVDSTVCPIPPPCLYTIGINSCWRVWYFLPGNLSSCESEQRCNWIDCVDTGAPGDSCRANCTALGANDTCVECNGDTCVEVPGLSQQQCNLGRSFPGTCDKLCGGVPCTSQTACENTGVCRNKDDDTTIDTITNPSNGFEYYNHSGLCFSPYIGSYYGDAQCGGDYDFQLRLDQLTYPFMRFGCPCDGSLNSNSKCNLSTTKTQCQNLGFLWVDNGITQTQCESSVTRCYEPARAWNLATPGAFTNKSLPECQLCGFEFASVLRWEKGVWTPPRNVTYQWVRRGMVPINRHVSRALDFIGFSNALESAAFATSALAYSSDALCRYGPEADAITAVTCDCLSQNSNCFSVTPQLILVDRVCPYVNYNITSYEVELRFYPTTMPPPSLCQAVKLFEIQAATYEVKARQKLTSEVFYENRPNGYSAVLNKHGSFIGQIISNVIEVSWNASVELTGHYTICILRDPTIPVSAIYTDYAIAVADDKGVVTYLIAASTVDGDRFCGDVTRQGRFMAAAVLPDHATHENYSAATKGMSIAAAILYFGLCLGTIIQIIRFAISTKKNGLKQPIGSAKIVALVASLVFTLTRGIFFIFPPSTWVAETTSSLMLFEVPGLLFFIMYTSQIFVGARIIIKVKSMRSKFRFDLVWKAKVWADVIMAVLFVVFVLIFYLIKEDSVLPCKVATGVYAKHQTVNLAYLIFLGIVSLALGLLVAIVSIMLLRILSKSEETTNKQSGGVNAAARGKQRVVRNMMILILISYPTMFIIRTALLIAAAADASVTIPVIVFALLECFPTAVLLYYIQPFLNRTIASSGSNTATTTSNSSMTSSNSSDSGDTRDRTTIVAQVSMKSSDATVLESQRKSSSTSTTSSPKTASVSSPAASKSASVSASGSGSGSDSGSVSGSGNSS